MKKILITFFVILLSINSTYAATCKIKNSTSADLFEYIENNRIIVKNITNELTKIKLDSSVSGKVSGAIDEIGGYLTMMYNEAFDYTGYYSYFTYYVPYPINNDIPKEIRRDYFLLENERKGLKSYLDNIISNKKHNTIINNACKNIKKDCDLNNKEALKIITELLLNIEKLQDLYRLTVMGKTSEYNSGEIFFIDKNQIASIKSDYSPKAYSGCVTAKEGFFATIMTAIEKIKNLNGQWEKGVKEWKEAIALLRGEGINGKSYEENEWEILKKELSRQGVSGSKQDLYKKSLADFNQNGLNLNNNYITNSFNNVYNEIKSEIQKFKNDVIGDFFEKKDSDFSTTQIKQLELKSQTTKEIKIQIETLYNELKPGSASQNASIKTLNDRIISTHINIEDSLNKLNKIIPVSEQVCLQQDGKRGICN